MAKLKSGKTYTLELTEEEAIHLFALFDSGVTYATIMKMSLMEVYNELTHVPEGTLSYYYDFVTNADLAD